MSLGNLLAGKGSPGPYARLLDEEGWVPGRDWSQELAFWGAGRYPSLCEKELKGFGMTKE